MIEIKALQKKYGKKLVLDSIDLSLAPGEVHGIVGENGAGKTTLFRAIAGLEEYKGSIIYKNSSKNITVGFLPTNPYFISKITGKEYLQLVCNARGLQGIDFIEKNIFDLPLQQYAETYSTGMKKKLALTGILLQNNDFFILDEPFNGVDIHSNLLINKLIVKLKQMNKTIVLSSHIFSTLHQTCDYLHYLKDGIINKSVDKSQFDVIEQAMQQSNIVTRIDNLNLK